MIYLQENSEPSTPTGKSLSYKQRKFWKIVVRLALLFFFMGACYIFSHGVQWKNLSENYHFSSKDVDLIQYLCNQSPFMASDEKLKSLAVQEEIEHKKVNYLFEQNQEPDTVIPAEVWADLPVKGAYYMIIRNEHLSNARSVLKSMEDHMSNGTKYPWVFLNNQAFTPEFKKYIKKITNAPVFFGKIDLEAWEYPHWIDVPRAEYLMMQQQANQVRRGISLSYHQLLRYQSGFFFHHPLFKDVEYTWRVEPGADYSCQMEDDMFLKMKNNNKTLGFVMTTHEEPKSIITLWKRVQEFVTLNPEYVLPKQETIFPWIYDSTKEKYNYCRFETSFQIAELSFFRSEAYQKYFQYLDRTGNFFYERWSDAVVQTIAAALFLKKEKIHFFNNIGYTHSTMTHCPYNETLLSKCSCDVFSNFDLLSGSCTGHLLNLIDKDNLAEMAGFIIQKGIKLQS